MNGTSTNASERTAMSAQICASALSEVENGGIWYQNV